MNVATFVAIPICGGDGSTVNAAIPAETGGMAAVLAQVGESMDVSST